MLQQYRLLSALRQSELALQRGWFCYVHADANVFAYVRELDGLDRAFLVLLNFGREAAVTDLSTASELPEQLTVLVGTDRGRDGASVHKSGVATQAGEGLVMQYSSATRFHRNHKQQCYVLEKACFLKVINILYKC